MATFSTCTLFLINNTVITQAIIIILFIWLYCYDHNYSARTILVKNKSCVFMDTLLIERIIPVVILNFAHCRNIHCHRTRECITLAMKYALHVICAH